MNRNRQPNKAWLARAGKTADRVAACQEGFKCLSQEEMQAKTEELKARCQKGEKLDALLPEAFALVREASLRVTGMEPFRVQVIGAVALHEGKIAELKTGEGKAVTVSTDIPTIYGWKKAGDIRAGDLMFGRDGNPTRVTGVFPQGKKEVYRVTLKDGRYIECCEDHLWSVYQGPGCSMKVLPTKALFANGVRSKGQYRYSLPMPGPVRYPEKQLGADPYVVGALLVIGRAGRYGELMLSTKSQELASLVAGILGAVCVKGKSGNLWTLKRADGEALKAKDACPPLGGCMGRDQLYERRVPEDYKVASAAQRKALLQGIFDSAGHSRTRKSAQAHIHYLTVSEYMCRDVTELLYSLGYSSRWGVNKHAEPGGVVHQQYQLVVNMPSWLIPGMFRISGKREEAEKKITGGGRIQYDHISITGIEKTGRMEEMVCFTVDNPEHLYLAGGYVVTHNTLVTAMPAYLNALEGKGVHIVTVNDYLAGRDAELMGGIHRYLGLSVGTVLSTTGGPIKKAAYACDITYVTNTELGFDYLRDNMAASQDHTVQRGYHYAIIDEADSILIDEARTPLVIAGDGSDVSKVCIACDQLAKIMVRGEQTREFNKADAMVGLLPEETGDFIVHEKEKTAVLTAQGIKKTEAYFGIANYSDPANAVIQHSMDAALRAVHIMKRDHDYIVKDGEVQIVDTFTGRALPGRRFMDGLHQALEAKEHVDIKEENRTVASTTYQNFFRKYKKICGMTGTAYTEKREFASTYGLKTVVVPTNQPMARMDRPDVIYLSKEGKYQGILEEVEKSLDKGQPVLVGTASVKASEEVSRELSGHNIPHRVLNAKQDAQEADIVAKAGISGTVTVATNMAGRGTDIIPDEAALAAGGLKVIGTERHDAQRIDNQLRGRSGRQGNPGESVFYISMDDDMVRMFAGDRFKTLAEKGSFDPCSRLDGKAFARAVRIAQKKVEDNHFSQRKNVLEFDRIDDSIREIVYTQRRKILAGDDVSAEARAAVRLYVSWLTGSAGKKPDTEAVLADFCLVTGLEAPAGIMPGMGRKKLEKALAGAAAAGYREKEAEAPDDIREIERHAILRSIDAAWTELLSALEYLRQDIYYLGYAQVDPKAGYAERAFELYGSMKGNVYRMVTYALFHFKPADIKQAAGMQEVARTAAAG